jgi:crotonobetainyl-CoA:carnitine CoA-transferase CaiB-like acyl-CoA transferase
MNKPFSHLKVIELASVLAGPSVGMFFAELGAKVLKIENKTQGGDITRSWKLKTENSEHPFSAYYSSVNYGKESLFLDLKDKSDYAALMEELKTTDLVIANFKAGDAIKLNLSFEEIKAVNPTVIYGEISGFGNSSRIAYDVVLQAESGFIAMNGTNENHLAKLPVAFIDLMAAHQLKEGLLLAILQQKMNKTALKVSVSLFDAALASLANQATNFLMAKHIAQPMGMLHPNIAPYGELFTTADGKKIVLAIGSKRQFASLLSVLSLEMQADFENNQDRLQHRSRLAEYLQTAISNWNCAALMEEFLKQGVPAGQVRKMNEVFELEEAQKRIISELKEGKELKTLSGNAFRIES